jgi:succinyl-CoA synthetase alpha subunit/GNAT superfamily N-acetyltransferase
MPPNLTRAASDAVDGILMDGGTLRLRPPEASDGDGLLEFFVGLSEQSRFLRFHGFRRIDRALVEPLLDPHLVRPRRARRLARCSRGERTCRRRRQLRPSWGHVTAEMAFAVADAEQGRGIGTRMLEQLAQRARDAGVTHFVAEVDGLARRRADCFFRVRASSSSANSKAAKFELRFPLEPTGAYSARVEERDHSAVVASLRPFFEPASVAVIGASRRRGSIGGELFRNILAADFAGAAYPVNRNGDPVAGVRAYRAIDEIPDPVDLAVICLPAEQVIDAASAALGRGVRAVCVISAGFAETGIAGQARQERLLALVRAHGARLVGPNCLGIAVPSRGLNATFAPRALPSGGIGFSSQSGALGLALLEKAAERNLGFSAFASIGNKADVSSNDDLLEWWEEDDETDLVLLYLESLGNPRSFARIARRVARRKPILALKAGSTSAGSRCGQLAHRCARKLERRGRRALPPGRCAPSTNA